MGFRNDFEFNTVLTSAINRIDWHLFYRVAVVGSNASVMQARDQLEHEANHPLFEERTRRDYWVPLFQRDAAWRAKQEALRGSDNLHDREKYDKEHFLRRYYDALDASTYLYRDTRCIERNPYGTLNSWLLATVSGKEAFYSQIFESTGIRVSYNLAALQSDHASMLLVEHAVEQGRVEELILQLVAHGDCERYKRDSYSVKVRGKMLLKALIGPSNE